LAGPRRGHCMGIGSTWQPAKMMQTGNGTSQSQRGSTITTSCVLALLRRQHTSYTNSPTAFTMTAPQASSPSSRPPARTTRTSSPTRRPTGDTRWAEIATAGATGYVAFPKSKRKSDAESTPHRNDHNCNDPGGVCGWGVVVVVVVVGGGWVGEGKRGGDCRVHTSYSTRAKNKGA
jgi:hypothetical protein